MKIGNRVLILLCTILLILYQKLNSEILKEAVDLNNLLLRTPEKKNNELVKLNYNIYEVYSDFLKNKKGNLKKEKNDLEIIRNDKNFSNFEEWLQKVVWYGHRSGDYISKTNYSKNKNFPEEISKIKNLTVN